jgi:hypothetical protein
VNTNATIRLARGGYHDCADGEACLFEWFNWLTIRQSTDNRPADVSPVLYQYGMSLNDALPDDKRQQLARFLPNGISPLSGTYGDGKDETRCYMALDWLIRICAPAWLDLAGLTAEAGALRDLGRVSGPESVRSASPGVDTAVAAAWAAAAVAAVAPWDAAWSAAWSAARAAAWDAAVAAARAAAAAAAVDAAVDAARYAAWDAVVTAAGDAVGDAAVDAARAAARAAAGDAAWDAAWDALATTVAQLQDSAIGLYDSMLTGEWPS